jgi:uncharacterized protein (TIGR02001 family)
LIVAPTQLALRGWLYACALALLAPAPACAQDGTGAIGGTLAVTSDYIYRGVSQSDGHGALQADLHASSFAGTFAGVWATTRDDDFEPGTSGEIQISVGQRFSLSTTWSATVAGRADYFVGGAARHSDDYQEICAVLSWLDRYTLSFTAIPNAVRYQSVVYQYGGYQHEYYQAYRSPAFVADAAGQWLLREGLFGGGLYLTAAAGYYYASRPGHQPLPASDYVYGNAGLALEWRRWRIDLGYFAAQRQAGELFPYPVAKRLAATVSWQF